MGILERAATRRAVLAAAVTTGLAGVAGAAWSVISGRAEDPFAKVAPAPTDETSAFPQAAQLSFVQVIAHPDDDLYFMNPGVQRTVSRGSKVATVLITAGEGDGINVDTSDSKRDRLPVDYAGYSGARHNGHRSAYARMATGNADSPWRTDVVALAGGLQVERCTLIARPTVSVYYLNLRKGPETAQNPNLALSELWSGAMPQQSTLPVPGSPVNEVQTVSKDQLLAGLVDILEKCAPTVVRTLDPDPEHDSRESGYVVSDHRDHTAVARFTLHAVATHRDRTGATPAVDHYRGYANRIWPYNLSVADVAAKATLIKTYAGYDGRPCPAHNCGDYQLGPNPVRSTHIYSTKLRHEPTTNWLVRAADGRLSLYAVLAGRVVGWQERTAGKDDWTGPTLIDAGRDGGWMLPVVNAVAGRDGRVHLVTLRRTEVSGGEARLEVVRAVREAGAADFGKWQPLGGPDTGEREQHEIGVPTAAADGDGRLHVFVRNYDQGLSAVVEDASGEWGDWTSLGGTELQDGPTAFGRTDGRVEVYAADKHGVQGWRQASPGADLKSVASVPATGPVASGRVTVVEAEDGAIALFYRQADTAVVRAVRQQKPDGDWSEQPVDLAGGDGVGPVATLWRLGKDVGDALSVRLGTDLAAHGLVGRDGSAQWPALGDVTVLRSASLALSQDGTPVVAVLGADGHPRVARYGSVAGGVGRYSTAAGDAGFGAWKTL
ncbi:PIG-L family deacetylase [Kitasatospora kazusensis]|uniref:PIG-L family deacetylase n=1 Tax=Kitasatospora kazusensis TaxID=407974 RepID=A0ABP5LP81_9ACTN